MDIDTKTISALATRLQDAERNVTPIEKITNDYPELGLTDAYRIQQALVTRKTEAGHAMVGWKMGLTSQAKMRQMSVDRPIYGILLDCFAEAESGEIDASRFIHPRVEAELAIVTTSSLYGPGCHIGAVFQATECVMPAVEIIDSRYRDFRFDLPSVIADNASSSGFIIGSRMMRPEKADLRALGVVLERNGEIIEVGAGAAVLGNPLSSVLLLANMLAERGEEIPAGSLVLTGGITAAVAMSPGDSLTVKFQNLSSITARFR